MAIYLHTFTPPLPVPDPDSFDAETVCELTRLIPQEIRNIPPDQAVPLKLRDWRHGRIMVNTDDSSGHTTAEINRYGFVKYENAGAKEMGGRAPEREALIGRSVCDENTPYVVIASVESDGRTRVDHIVRYNAGNT